MKCLMWMVEMADIDISEDIDYREKRCKQCLFFIPIQNNFICIKRSKVKKPRKSRTRFLGYLHVPSPTTRACRHFDSLNIHKFVFWYISKVEAIISSTSLGKKELF